MSVLWGYKPLQFYPSGCRFSRKMWVEAIGENKQTPVNRLESIDQSPGQIPFLSRQTHLVGPRDTSQPRRIRYEHNAVRTS